MMFSLKFTGEEIHRNVMLAKKTIDSVESSALVTENIAFEGV